MLAMTVSGNHDRSTVAWGKWLGAAVVAAIVPAPFLVIGAVSLVVRRPFLELLTRSAGRTGRGLATRLTIWWTVGLAVVTVGEAAGAALGAMDLFKLSGLVVHCLYGLGVVAVLVAGTVISLSRA